MTTDTDQQPASAPQIGHQGDQATEAPTPPVGEPAAPQAEPERHPDAPPISDMLPVAADRATGLVSFNDRQVEVIRRTVGKDLNPYELDFFLAQCKRLDLDPFTGQIYAWKEHGKVVTMTSIHGLRVVRDRTGKYAGKIGPMWCGKDGEWELDSNGDPKPWLHDVPPAAARVGILHADRGEFVSWGVATFDAFGKPAKTSSGKANGMWATPGGAAHMLAKCAEAMGLREAFPNDLSGVYTDDEMPESVQATRVDQPPEPQPGLGDPVVEAAMADFHRLSDEAKAKIDQWWCGPYCAKFMTTRHTVPAISDGGLFVFKGRSPHVAKAADMIDRAIAAGALAPDPDPDAGDDDQGDEGEQLVWDRTEHDGEADAGDDDLLADFDAIEDAEIVPEPDPVQQPPGTGLGPVTRAELCDCPAGTCADRDDGTCQAVHDVEHGTDAWTLEEQVLAYVEEVGAATVASIAKGLGMKDSRPLRNPVNALFAAGELELMPDAPPGPRTYQLPGTTTAQPEGTQ